MQGALKLPSLRALKLITLDVTGTLLQFSKSPVRQYIETANRHGVTVDEDLFAYNFDEYMQYKSAVEPHFGRDWRAWWIDFAVEIFTESKPEGKAHPIAYKKIATELIEHYKSAECWEVKDGVQEFLSVMDTLRAHEPDSGPRLQLGVISNFDPRLEDILRVTKLRDHFDFVVASHSIQKSKPDPAIFRHALDTAHEINTSQDPWSNFLLPAQALHIGNKTDNDFEAARRAGWHALIVMSPQEYAQKMPKIPYRFRMADPPVIFPTLVDVLQHFESLASASRTR